MEPTIYKPSIYKGAGIYNIGAGGGGIVDTGEKIGDRFYKTIEIDGKIWLAENLDFNFAPSPANKVQSTPGCWYYNNNQNEYGWNGKKWGLIYNGYAARFLEQNKSNLCPGWHVPTMTEWNSLFNFLNVSLAGKKLKSKPPEWNGTDDYNFTLFAGGYIYDNYFVSKGDLIRLWTSTSYGGSYDYGVVVSTNSDSANIQNHLLSQGNYIRLIKD